MKQHSGGKFHYAFLVVIVYAIALPAVFLFSNSFGLYMVPITEELGISHGAYSLTQSFNEIVSGVLYFLYVRIERRFKIRYIITAGAFGGLMDRQRGLASGYAVHHVADFGGDGAGIPCDTRPPGGKKTQAMGCGA